MIIRENAGTFFFMSSMLELPGFVTTRVVRTQKFIFSQLWMMCVSKIISSSGMVSSVAFLLSLQEGTSLFAGTNSPLCIHISGVHVSKFPVCLVPPSNLVTSLESLSPNIIAISVVASTHGYPGGHKSSRNRQHRGKEEHR